MAQVRPPLRRRNSQEAGLIHEDGSQWRWHLDEVFVKINGVQHYLWRAVDHNEGEVLESLVTKTRDRKAVAHQAKRLVELIASLVG